MWTRVQRTLAGLPTFCPMTFHLFASYSLIASRSFMDCAKSVRRLELEDGAIFSYNHKGDIPHLRQIQRNAYPELKCQRHRNDRADSVGGQVFSYLVPVLLHTALSPRRESLRQVRKKRLAQWSIQGHVRKSAPWRFRSNSDRRRAWS